MKLIYLIFFILTFKGYSQIDFEEHIKSIQNNYYQSEDMNGMFNANERSVAFALGYLQKKGVNKRYITNKKLLNKISVKSFKKYSYIYFYDKLENGTKISIKINFKKFDKTKHSINIKDGYVEIDSLTPIGSYYEIPKLEIDCIEIKVNKKEVIIPKSSYIDLYEVTQEKFKQFYKPIEAYSSHDGEFIFIYIFGGNAADSFFSKLIFNKEKFITRITADYKQLLEWHTFNNDNFLGY